MFQCPNTVDEWLAIADEFWEIWNFPLCLGAIDGKHVAIRKPSGSGSRFYNYKHFFSIILLAVCDAHYKFLFVDIGSQGRCSDGGVFAESDLNEALQENVINIPDKAKLPGTDILSPFCLVADEAFPLRNYIMKPYPQRNLIYQQRIYNYRISRARKCVECGFGIMANKFRVFINPICLQPAKVDVIVLACCSMHNMLRTIVPSRYNVADDEINETSPSTSQPTPSGSRSVCATMQPARVSARRSATQSAKKFRDTLSEYFLSDAGAVEWQDKMI